MATKIKNIRRATFQGSVFDESPNGPFKRAEQFQHDNRELGDAGIIVFTPEDIPDAMIQSPVIIVVSVEVEDVEPVSTTLADSYTDFNDMSKSWEKAME